MAENRPNPPAADGVSAAATTARGTNDGIPDVRPADVQSLTRLGMQLAANHQFADSIRAFATARDRRPDSASTQYNLAIALLNAGRSLEALEPFRETVRLAPLYSPGYLGWISALERLKLDSEILAVYECAERNGCRDAVLALNHGVELSHAGREREAIERLLEAKRLRPALAAEADFNRGTALAALGEHREAIAAFGGALAVRPAYPQCQVNRGISYAALGEHAAALGDFAAALRVDGSLGPAHRAYGISSLALGRYEHAIAHLQRAVAIDRTDREGWEALGDAHLAVRGATASIDSFDHALQLLDGAIASTEIRARLLNKRFEALITLGEFDAALRCAIELCRVDPDYPYAAGYQLFMAASTGDWNSLEQLRTDAIAGTLRGEPRILPFPLLSITPSSAVQRAGAESFIERAQLHQQAPLYAGGGDRRDRIRVAYVSPDFRDHPVGHLIAATIEAHDRSRFDVTAFSTFLEPGQDPTHGRLRDAFDEFIDVSRLDDDAVASLLRDRNIDIAIDLAGHTRGGRPGIFARRAAAVQVNFLGFPGTYGAHFIDYIVCDDIVVPPSLEAGYTERVARLPGCFLPPGDARPRPETRTRRVDVGLHDDAIVLCAFHNGYKIMPEVFAIWARLLAAHPRAILWMSEPNPQAGAAYRRALNAAGARPEQLVFAPREPRRDAHLARLGAADLLLDTFPYNAHSSAVDALWAGVPIVTCSAESFASRVGQSLLRALGLPELATDSLEAYGQLAHRLIARPEEIAALKARLAVAVLTSDFFDPVRHARRLEAAFELMWRRAERGEAPQAFGIPG